MTKINVFDSYACDTLRERVQRAPDGIDLDGVTVRVGRITYGPHSATIKVTAETEGAEDQRSDALELAMRRHSVANREAGGHRLVDYHPKKRKFPFIMVGPQGGRWKLSPDQARSRFGRVQMEGET